MTSCLPKGIGSKERLDDLYKQFIKQFNTGRNWTYKFVPLLFKSPDSARRLFTNLPTFLSIRGDFEPKKNSGGVRLGALRIENREDISQRFSD